MLRRGHHEIEGFDRGDSCAGDACGELGGDGWNADVRSDLQTVKGHCFSGSSRANRNDAWRCLSKNLLYDPCFSSSKAKGIVLCPAAAWRRSGVKIILTQGLPTKFGNKRAPSTNVRPWAMQTISGIRCVREGMGPFIIPTVVGDYACTNGKWLWGQPNRKTQPWTIYMASVTATTLTTKARIRIAWF